MQRFVDVGCVGGSWWGLAEAFVWVAMGNRLSRLWWLVVEVVVSSTTVGGGWGHRGGREGKGGVDAGDRHAGEGFDGGRRLCDAYSFERLVMRIFGLEV